MDDNLGSLLEAVGDLVRDRDPGRVAVAQGDRARTWAELDRRAAGLAGHLERSGVVAGDRVGIGLYNSIEYVESLLAVFKLRAVPVNVNYRYREDELVEVLGHTAVDAVVHDASLTDPLVSAALRLPRLRSMVQVGGPAGGGSWPAGAAFEGTGFEDAVAGPAQQRRERSPADQILILTGGTTGRPKAVVWDHVGVSSVVCSVYRRLGLTPPTNRAELLAITASAVDTGAAPVMLPVSPLMHGTGFFFSLGNLLLGGRIVCPAGQALAPTEVWSAVQRHRVQEMAIVGDAFGRPLLAELDRAAAAGRPYDVSSLRRVVSSGVTWSADVKERFLRAGRITLQDSIASTEGGPYGVSLVGPEPGRVTTRFTLPPTARVIRPDGTDVVPGSGETGELASSGNLPLGYLDDPERTAMVFRVLDGVRYAVPGDRARLEADGTLTLLGRGSGVINTGGEKVFVEEVEEVLLGHPDVEEAVVVGVADARWGSRVTALVRAVPGRRPPPEALTEHVGQRLAGYKKPQQVVFVPAIEHTISGKTDRRWAQARAQQAAAASGSARSSQPDITRAASTPERASSSNPERRTGKSSR